MVCELGFDWLKFSILPESPQSSGCNWAKLCGDESPLLFVDVLQSKIPTIPPLAIRWSSIQIKGSDIQVILTLEHEPNISSVANFLEIQGCYEIEVIWGFEEITGVSGGQVSFLASPPAPLQINPVAPLELF